MAGISKRFSRFWEELKRRKTDRVVIMYAAASFAILQLVDILLGGLSLPEWIMTLTIIIVAVGFPIAAVFSWFFDITPGGIERTKPAGHKKIKVMEAQLRKWRETTMISFIIIIALVIFNIVRGNIRASEIRNTEKTLAVLPFENLSTNEELPFKYDDLILQNISDGLRQINMLQVTEIWEVLQFKSKKRPIPSIAKKLNVSFLVTGEFMSGKDLYLVVVHLIRVSGNKALTIWSDKYSFDPHGIFAELDKIPMDIGNKLKLVLSTEEKDKIKKKPTLNTAAFFNYLEGSTYQDVALNGSIYLSMGDSVFMDLSVAESFDRAISYYDKAIKSDPNFALAYAKRAITRSWGHQAGRFTTQDQKDKCLDDIRQAFRLDKDLAEAGIANGFYYYYFIKDYNKALECFKEVLDTDPNKWEIKFFMALVYRAMGSWDQSQALMREVTKHNLRNALFLTNIGLSYQTLHQYDSAIYYHDKAIEVMPRWSGPYQNKIDALVLKNGNTYAAEIVIDTAIKRTNIKYFSCTKVLFDLYYGRYKDALVRMENSDVSYSLDIGGRYLLFAEIYKNLKNADMAGYYYKSALGFYEECLVKDPDNPVFLSNLGIAAAGLNYRTKALEAGQKAVSIIPYNCIEKGDRMKDLATIYVLLREYDKARDVIGILLKIPSSLSPGLLKLEPVWKPILNARGYEKLKLQ
jgi:tetratricopeptide (TPR) repeat protein